MTTAVLPTTVHDAVTALADDPTIDVVAGATDVMVDVNAGRRTLRRILALRGVGELGEWSAGDDIVIGATVTVKDIATGDLARLVPALADAARTIGSAQIRAMATIGGNLGTASPAGDLLPVLIALDAGVVLASPNGLRRVLVEDFLTGHRSTARRDDELIHSVTVPVRGGSQVFAKVGPRNAMAIAIASCAVAVTSTGAVRCALGSVGPTVVRARDAEAWLAARADVTAGPPAAALVSEFGIRVAREAVPRDDHRGTAAYRTRAVEVLASRLLARAARGAIGEAVALR